MHNSVRIALIEEEWSERIDSFPGCTFFDSGAWLDTFAYKTDGVHQIGFFDGNACVASICLGINGQGSTFEARTPFSASFGGLLYAADITALTLDAVVRSLLEHLRGLAGGKPMVLDYVQRPRYVSGHPRFDLEEFSLLKNGFALHDAQLEYYLDLDDLRYSKTLQNELRKKQGMIFTASNMEEFLAFRERITLQQGKTKTIPDEEMRVMGDRFGQSIKLYKATSEGRTAAMLLSDELNQEVAMGRNWFQDAELSRLGATAFIVSEWVNELRRKGFAHAGFGATASLGGELRPGFLFFKERFHPKASLRKHFMYRAQGE